MILDLVEWNDWRPTEIGGVREFVSLPGACALLNQEDLKALIERNCQEKLKKEIVKLIAKDSSLTHGKAKKQVIQNVTQTMRTRIHKPGV